MSAHYGGRFDAVAALDALGARRSPDLDAYAAGELPASAIRCVLCDVAPCACTPCPDCGWGSVAPGRPCPACTT